MGIMFIKLCSKVFARLKLEFIYTVSFTEEKKCNLIQIFNYTAEFFSQVNNKFNLVTSTRKRDFPDKR